MFWSSYCTRVFAKVDNLAVQVAGSGETLKDGEGEVVEQRVLVHRVLHLGHLGEAMSILV